MMKSLLCIVLFGALVFPALVSGQPVIDSLKVIPAKGELVIFGKFGSTQGVVRVEGVPVSAISWKDSEIVCTIPDSGKGSAGAVVVSNELGTSDPHFLSLIRCYRGYSHNEDHSRASGNYNSASVWSRVDLQTAILSNATRIELAVDTYTVATLGSYWATQWDPEYGYETEEISHGSLRARYDSTYSSGFRGPVELNPIARSMRLYVRDIQGVHYNKSGSYKSISSVGSAENFTVDFTFDRDFQPVCLDSMIYMYGGVYQDHITQGGAVDFAPKALVALLDKPRGLTAADNESEVTVLWDFDERFDFFEIQLSKSDSFGLNTELYVSPNGGRSIAIDRGIKYFWRVRGTNSFGKSQWSPTASFLLPLKGSVGFYAHQPLRISQQSIEFSFEGEPRKLIVSDLLGRLLDERTLIGIGKLDLSSYPRPCLIKVENESSILLTQ
jgi:hypothetical protein